MNAVKMIVYAGVASLCLVGCQTPATSATVVYKPVVVERKRPPQPPVPKPRNRTPEQIQMLQDFAIKESPRIWQTIQSMRAEIAESDSRLKALRADLLEFNRNPDTDEDYRALVAGIRDLRIAYDAIFDRLESAFIAAKKFEASPSRKDYRETMKRALEDGIQDATMATERYRAMARQK